ncbi:UNVERIFIED_CONTAM: hypothetical protein K2H54_029221 [Gekko kuhli]
MSRLHNCTLLEMKGFCLEGLLWHEEGDKHWMNGKPCLRGDYFFAFVAIELKNYVPFQVQVKVGPLTADGSVMCQNVNSGFPCLSQAAPVPSPSALVPCKMACRHSV